MKAAVRKTGRKTVMNKNEFVELKHVQTVPVPEVADFLKSNEVVKKIGVTFLTDDVELMIDLEEGRLEAGKQPDQKLEDLLEKGRGLIVPMGDGFTGSVRWAFARWLNGYALAKCLAEYSGSDCSAVKAYWQSAVVPAEEKYDSCGIWSYVPESPLQVPNIGVAVCQVPPDCGVSKEQMIHMVNAAAGSDLLCLSAESRTACCEGFIGFETAEKLCFELGNLKRFIAWITEDLERESESGYYVFVAKAGEEWIPVKIWISYDCN